MNCDCCTRHDFSNIVDIGSGYTIDVAKISEPSSKLDLSLLSVGLNAIKSVRSTEIVLYEQSVIGNEGVVSNVIQFAPILDTQAADDFIVPIGQIWSINTIITLGVYVPFPDLPILTPSLSGINVFIYADDGGKPGASVYEFLNYNNFTDADGVFTFSFSNIELMPGHYWLSVQPIILNTFFWAWIRTPVLTNNPAMIRGNIVFSKCGPTVWGTIADCSTSTPPGSEPDLVFAILGERQAPPCVYPDTKVHVPGNKTVAIKDIKAGDKVINRLGEEIEVIYNMKFEPKVSDFIEIPKSVLNVTDNLLIRKKHPVWWRNKEVLAESLPKHTGNLVKEVSIDRPVNVYSLCTKERSFVLMNNLPVCTWEQKDWEAKVKAKRITPKYTIQ